MDIIVGMTYQDKSSSDIVRITGTIPARKRHTADGDKFIDPQVEFKSLTGTVKRRLTFLQFRLRFKYTHGSDGNPALYDEKENQ